MLLFEDPMSVFLRSALCAGLLTIIVEQVLDLNHLVGPTVISRAKPSICDGVGVTKEGRIRTGSPFAPTHHVPGSLRSCNLCLSCSPTPPKAAPPARSPYRPPYPACLADNRAFLSTRRTAFLIPARTLSLTVQSMVAFLLTVSTNSWALERGKGVFSLEEAWSVAFFRRAWKLWIPLHLRL